MKFPEPRDHVPVNQESDWHGLIMSLLFILILASILFFIYTMLDRFHLNQEIVRDFNNGSCIQDSCLYLRFSGSLFEREVCYKNLKKIDCGNKSYGIQDPERIVAYKEKVGLS